MARFPRQFRTAAGGATVAAFLLVLLFGNPSYVSWANSGPRGLFLQNLAWPAWAVGGGTPARQLIAEGLKALLLVVLTYVFVTAMAGSKLAGARGSVAVFLTGWAGYMFAAALAALVAAVIATGSVSEGFSAANDGAGYGLIVGWIVGVASMAGRRA